MGGPPVFYTSSSRQHNAYAVPYEQAYVPWGTVYLPLVVQNGDGVRGGEGGAATAPVILGQPLWVQGVDMYNGRVFWRNSVTGERIYTDPRL